MITAQLIENAYTFESYTLLLQSLLKEGKTTGANQSAEFLNYAKLNLQRMQRLEKTLTLQADLLLVLSQISSDTIFLVITEGWCGDAAQSLPLFNLISKACPKIELKLILRDEHPELIDRFLTNGSRSIPILICLEKESLKELFTWGPRPYELQQKVVQLLASGGSKEEKGLFTQTWYNHDQTRALQNELLLLFKKNLTGEFNLPK